MPSRIASLVIYKVPTVLENRIVGSLEVAATTPAHARAIVDRFYREMESPIRATNNYYRIHPRVRNGSHVFVLAETPTITQELRDHAKGNSDD